MSSKIIRQEAASEFQPLRWNSWSTDVIDTGATVSEQPARPDRRPAEELENELQQRLDAARRQGHQEGENAARAAYGRELDVAARQMALAVQNAVREKARLRAEAERDVVRIALAIAHKILRREVRIDPQVALGLVKAAMEAVSAREMQVVRTTPSLAQALTTAMSGLGLPDGVRVVPDASLEPGGLVVETSRGEVDASLETQFEEISTGLLAAVSDGGKQ